MPIKSYLAHPIEGKKENLVKEFSTFSECEIVTAKNENVLIIVTQTETEDDERILRRALDELPSLKMLALVSGFDTPTK